MQNESHNSPQENNQTIPPENQWTWGKTKYRLDALDEQRQKKRVSSVELHFEDWSKIEAKTWADLIASILRSNWKVKELSLKNWEWKNIANVGLSYIKDVPWYTIAWKIINMQEMHVLNTDNSSSKIEIQWLISFAALEKKVAERSVKSARVQDESWNDLATLEFRY